MVRSASIVIARFCLSLIFLIAGIEKILNWHETETGLFQVLSDWITRVSYSDWATRAFGALIPWTPFILMAATMLELVGGLFVLLGFKEKIGAGLLILFLVPATLIMHPFWYHDGLQSELQGIMFLKNLALLGGLILVAVHGAQAKGSSGFSSFPMD